MGIASISSHDAHQDDVVFMPFTTFSRRIAGSDRFALMVASARDADRNDDAKEQLTSVLRARRRVLSGEEDDFAVRDPREVQAVLDQVTGVLFGVFPARKASRLNPLTALRFE